MAGSRKKAVSEKQTRLFELGPAVESPPLLKRGKHPVWTENKANCIQTYLRLFVYVTKSGVYIDGFAGPQQPDKPDSWSAQLVLSSTPRWFRKFFFFETDEEKVEMLRELEKAQPPRDKTKKEPKRIIEIFPGDMNANILQILDEKKIGMKEAVFCLLDQWTNQCDWATVQALAKYKTTGNKIEIFYFLANSWMNRSLAATKDEDHLRRWWGNDDWKKLREMRGYDRALLLTERFKSELGYKYVAPWPIYDKQDGRKIMFFMIHASDHPEAPKLMSRAYHKAVTSEKEFEQLLMELDLSCYPSGS